MPSGSDPVMVVTSERLGQRFLNRTSAGGIIGTEAVVRAPPDGYMLLVVDSAPTINVTYYSKLNFDFIRDIAPVAAIASQPGVMEVKPSVPTKTVPEFIAFARSTPGDRTDPHGRNPSSGTQSMRKTHRLTLGPLLASASPATGVAQTTIDVAMVLGQEGGRTEHAKRWTPIGCLT
jgi:tripartite-type tricarboxylate transporter receptor subunit TctC